MIIRLKKFLKERKTYKALVRKKKRKAKINLHEKLEDFRTKNPRTFWKWINEVTDQTPTDSIPVPIEVMRSHLELLNSATPANQVFDQMDHIVVFNPMTDAQITQEEVEFAIKHLKTHKAPGWDGLSPSLFKLWFTANTASL